MAAQHGESPAAVPANLLLQPTRRDTSAVYELFQYARLSYSGHSVVQSNLQHLEQYLLLLSVSVTKATNEDVLQCVLFARTARAVQRALEELAPTERRSGVDALYCWMKSTSKVDADWITSMKRRQSESGRLWATDADCHWWETHIRADALKIKSFNRLKVLAAKFEIMTVTLGGDVQRRDFWQKELKEERYAHEMRQVLEEQFPSAGEEITL